MGFERGAGGHILGFSIESPRRPYNTLALPCECVIIIIINVKNAVYRHVNGKIAQLKQQISELGFLVVVHIVNVNVQHN